MNELSPKTINTAFPDGLSERKHRQAKAYGSHSLAIRAFRGMGGATRIPFRRSVPAIVLDRGLECFSNPGPIEE
jgi:hypothetical protein